MHQKRFTLQEVVGYVGNEHQMLPERFSPGKAALPSFGTAINGNVKTYIFSLESIAIDKLRSSLGTLLHR